MVQKDTARGSRPGASADFVSFLYFYVSFSLVVLFSYAGFKLVPDFPAWIWIAETCTLVEITFSTSVIIEIIFIGPVFCPLAWKSCQLLWEHLPHDPWRARWKGVLDALYIAFITVIVTGATLHGLANALNEIAKQQGAVTGVLYHSIYFWDEVLSHYLFPAGFFGMLLVSTVVDSRACNTDVGLVPGEMLATLLMAAGLGGLWSYALLEGQSAWVYWFVSMGSIITILVVKLARRAREQALKECKGSTTGPWRFSIGKNPFVLLVLAYSISNVAIIVAWAIAYWPLKPCVPYLYQPHETGSSLVIWIATLAIVAGTIIIFSLLNRERNRAIETSS
nr:hypothetical protein [Candidatus Sigynarchaeota archaeon]